MDLLITSDLMKMDDGYMVLYHFMAQEILLEDIHW